MAKTKISEYDVTAGNNTDINSINIDEGCSPATINNAIRALMSHLKTFETGAAGDSLVVGGNLSVTGTTSLTGALTASGGITGNITGNVTGNATGSSGSISNTGGWAVTPSGTTLYFSYNGTNVAKLDSSGNLTVKANVTAYGTV